jgi:arginyl-tRNA synthetase
LTELAIGLNKVYNAYRLNAVKAQADGAGLTLLNAVGIVMEAGLSL